MEGRFMVAFNFMVGQAIVLGAVKGYILAIDSTAFKVYRARETPRRVSLIWMLMLVGLEEPTFLAIGFIWQVLRVTSH